MIVLKNGEAQYEGYFNGCTAASCINIFSVTKSIISILIGIAIASLFKENTGDRMDFIKECVEPMFA